MGAYDGERVTSLANAQVDTLRSILWEMDDVSCSTSTEFHGVEVTTTNNNGEEETATKTVTKTVLTITITHKTAVEMAGDYHFNSRQNEYLALMMQPDNQALWAQLLHSLVTGGGQTSFCVTPGQQVPQVDEIGFIGNIGNSTGNHLHFETRVNEKRTDPMSFFSAS